MCSREPHLHQQQRRRRARTTAREIHQPGERPARAIRPAGTADAAGRTPAAYRACTPRQRRKLSAACSISMPRPSAARVTCCSRAQRRNGVGASRIDQVVGEGARDGRSPVGQGSATSSRRPALVALITTSKSRPARSCTVRDRAPGPPAQSARRARSALLAVRLTTVTERGARASSGRMMPRAAPPAPSTSTSIGRRAPRAGCA